MDDIHVDMFEVQLGASLLIQVRAGRRGAIRILADAGIHAHGYERDHVHRKLPAAMDRMGAAGRRLDLVIGTHYDRDHLAGLAPIIDDETI